MAQVNMENIFRNKIDILRITPSFRKKNNGNVLPLL